MKSIRRGWGRVGISPSILFSRELNWKTRGGELLGGSEEELMPISCVLVKKSRGQLRVIGSGFRFMLS